MIPETENVPIRDEEFTVAVPQDLEQQQEEESSTTPSDPSRRCCSLFVKHIYQGLVDLFLVIAVMLMGFFVYDVEVSIVKDSSVEASHETPWGPSGRVIVRNDDGRPLRARMTSVNLV